MNWKLEILRMSLYMTFPVGLFYYFNQPQYFEEWVVKRRRELFPPDNNPEARAMAQLIKEHRKKREQDLIEQLKQTSPK